MSSGNRPNPPASDPQIAPTVFQLNASPTCLPTSLSPSPSRPISRGNCTPLTNAAGRITIDAITAQPPTSPRKLRRVGLAKRGCQNRQVIAQGEGNRDAARLQDASQGQRVERDRHAAEEHCIGRPAQPDARQGHGEYQPEGEGGPAENRAEHAVPNEFHEEEREAGDAGHDIDDVRRQRCCLGRTLVPAVRAFFAVVRRGTCRGRRSCLFAALLSRTCPAAAGAAKA